jgi:hypothetical protein
VSDPVAVITEIRIIKNVKVSTLHQKADRYRDGFVKLFREHEHAYLVNEAAPRCWMEPGGALTSLHRGSPAR